MGTGIYFPLCAFFFLIVILVIFLKKEKIKTFETDIYKWLLITNFFGLILEMLCTYASYIRNTNHILSQFILKTYLVYNIVWVLLLTIYVLYITFNKNKLTGLVKKIGTVLFFVCSIIVYTLKCNLVVSEDFAVRYTNGPSVSFTYGLSSVFIGVMVIAMLLNIKKLKSKKFIPIFTFIIAIVIGIIIQSFNPSFLIMTYVETLTLTIMYFTIENPDLKMVNELYKNKKIMEQTYVDKSNFLFEMTQELRDPMFNIKKLCNDIKSSNDIEDYKKSIEKINNYSKQLDYIVNDILNVNSLDSQSIKFIDNKYNFELIANEVISQVKEAINKDVKFTYDIDKEIKMLYGDSIKIKQVLSSLLLDSVRRTEEGFIDLRIDSIRRFDALRIVVQIKDTSKGIPIDVVNDILNTTASLDTKEIELLEKNEINIELCQKIVKLMGGNLLIKSTEKKGTEVILTIDQRIDELKDSSVIYEEYVDRSKKVAIVNQDKKLNEYIKKIFNANDIHPTILLNGLNLIDQIKAGKKYDYIIVANNMKSINGYTVYQKLKEIKNFNTPVMIMIEKESLKKHLLEDGFKEVILLENAGEELEKIIDKY